MPWQVHYDSNPFKAYVPITLAEEEAAVKSGSSTPLADVSVKRLAGLVKGFQQRGLRIALWVGDALLLCLTELPSNMLFDAIDTSNLADQVGLVNLLACVAPRLKRHSNALRHTSTMTWSSAGSTFKEYFERAVGIDPKLFPTIFGLKLATDTSLTRKSTTPLPLLRYGGIPHEDRMLECSPAGLTNTSSFLPSPTPLTLWTQPEACALVKALRSLQDKCIRLHVVMFPDGEGCVLKAVTPITYAIIVKHLSKRLAGGTASLVAANMMMLNDPVACQLSCCWKTAASVLQLTEADASIPLQSLSATIRWSDSLVKAPNGPLVHVLLLEGKAKEFNLIGDGVHILTNINVNFEKSRLDFLLPAKHFSDPNNVYVTIVNAPEQVMVMDPCQLLDFHCTDVSATES
eukprot:jgi/Chlat1/5977/Chrsp4S06295